MTIRITLADLTYTNQGYPSVSFPFGAALVASYAKKMLGDKIECELFKYPNDLLSLDMNKSDKFHYNFVEIAKRNFNDAPFLHFNSQKLNINFSHSNEQKALISKYIGVIGSSMNNLGTILSKSIVEDFYRKFQI